MNWPPTIVAKGILNPHLVETNPDHPVDPEKFLDDFINRRSNVHLRFTIHGFWPGDYTQKNPLKNCFEGQTLGYDPVEVKSFLNITDYWIPFLKNEGSFWYSEWMKHGKCATGHPRLTTHKQYFEQAIQLAEDLDRVQREFKKQHFHSKQPYGAGTQFETFQAFFYEQHKFAVKINFHQFETINKYEHVVVENWVESIDFCYDLDFKPIGCIVSQDYLRATRGQALYLPKRKSFERLAPKKSYAGLG